MEQRNEEMEQTQAQNSELLVKLQAITNEFAVVKSDSEIIKQKARQMLIEKDEELERMRQNKSGSGQTGMSPSKEPMMMGGTHGSGDARQQRDSQPDSGASTFSEGSMMVASIIEADNSQLIKD